MYKSHTGNKMFALSKQILDVLCPTWKDKIIGVTTGGALNMTGCHVGMGIQIQQVCEHGFYLPFLCTTSIGYCHARKIEITA
jgi:hypothetical protein